MLLVRETCEYHGRKKEYCVILEKPVGTTADWNGSYGGSLCQLLTDNLFRVIIIQFCTKLHCACQEQCYVCLGSH